MAWMKQHRIILIISFVLAILIVQLNLLDSLLLFLLVGVIPGTNYSVPPFLMVCGALVLAWFVIVSSTYRLGNSSRKTVPKNDSRSNNLPKRRYAR